MWSLVSDSGGILKTTTIEIKISGEQDESSARSSVVPQEWEENKDWEEALQSKTEGEPSALLNMIVEQGRLAKEKRRMD